MIASAKAGIAARPGLFGKAGGQVLRAAEPGPGDLVERDEVWSPLGHSAGELLFEP